MFDLYLDSSGDSVSQILLDGGLTNTFTANDSDDGYNSLYIGSIFIALSYMFNHIFLEAGGWDIYMAKPTGEIVYNLL